MRPPRIHPSETPEGKIKEAVKRKLQSYGWLVFVTHGNQFQMGLPDLYCIHVTYGVRWVEVKNPKAYSFTGAQMQVFPQFQSCGIGIWILTSDDDGEIDKLFQPANWWAYLGVMK